MFGSCCTEEYFLAHSQSMQKRKEALIEPHDENSPPLLPIPLGALFLLEMRAVMTGEFEVSEITWWD